MEVLVEQSEKVEDEMRKKGEEVVFILIIPCIS